MMIRASEPPMKARRSDRIALTFEDKIECSVISNLCHCSVGKFPITND